MADPVVPTLRQRLAGLDPRRPEHAVETVHLILKEARDRRASDIHLNPTADHFEIWFRIDGAIQQVADLPVANAPAVVARLKVLAGLLTYQTETPQEGRLRADPGAAEVRISTMPTLHGERAVLRLFSEPTRLRRLEDLGLPLDIRGTLRDLLDETSGLIVVAGPAGSGKTTTLYAALRELAAVPIDEHRRSLISLEDPIESAVDGVSQTQVHPASNLDLAAAIRAALRQDPEVIAVGELRDADTTEAAFNAALTGHLVLTTMHAGSASDVVGRCLDMGIEPYILRSSLLGIVAQRLVRRLCACAVETTDPPPLLGLRVPRAFLPVGCADCAGTGFRGRIPLAELLSPRSGPVSRAMLERVEVEEIEARAVQAGMIPRRRRGLEAVASGLTSPAEYRRAFGLRDLPDRSGHE